MSSESTNHEPPTADARPRRRADAQRNIGSLLEAAKEVFASEGVDAPAKEIADRAGVGVGTLYRHFPKRSDLVLAVLEHDVEACVEAARTLSAAEEPGDALVHWIGRYTDVVATKRGLAAALHSGDAAFEGLGQRLLAQLEPSLAALLERAEDAGAIRRDVDPDDLLRAVAHLCAPGPDGTAFSQRMVRLLLDGLRA